MDGPHLVYFADPMCSWCWGFAAVIEAVEQAFGDTLPIRLVMGGLRPGTTEVMAETAKAELRGHWAHVTEASGQPFGPSGLDGEGFIYDTDPSARAVVLMRRRRPDRALAFLEAAQRGFYAEGLDITQAGVLGDLAATFGEDAASFVEDLESDGVKQETWRDYAISRGAGVTGFPTLIMGPQTDKTYIALARGFQPAASVLGGIGQLVAAAT